MEKDKSLINNKSLQQETYKKPKVGIKLNKTKQTLNKTTTLYNKYQ